MSGSGRKLTWLWNQSKAEIRTTYLPQKYIFQVGTYQLAILLLFNESDTCTFKEIQEGTRISEGLLKNYLVPMVKLKVLLQDGDSYDLNLSTFSLLLPLCPLPPYLLTPPLSPPISSTPRPRGFNVRVANG